MTAERPRWGLHALLLVATLLTTLRAGVMNAYAFHEIRARNALLGFDAADPVPWWTSGEVWLQAVGFSLTLVGILFAHEMGHYLTARRRGVPMSPPFFLPWFEPLGTLGAVIAMDPRPTTSRNLMRVAAMGPFAGMAIALPAVVFGLMWSDVRPVPDGAGVQSLGVCLLMQAVQQVVHGPLPPGHDVYLHPVALAGWAGCLVTSLNLLPLGQLDGGHIVYAMIGDRFTRFARRAFWLLAIGAALVYPPWLFLLAIVAYAMGTDHPDLITDGAVRGVDRWVGRLAMLLLVATFTPRPFLGVFPGLLELLGLL